MTRLSLVMRAIPPRFDRITTVLATPARCLIGIMIFSGVSIAQCNARGTPSPSAARPLLHVLISERLFTSVNRTDAIASVKLWGDVITCMEHLDVDAKVDMVETTGELRRRVESGMGQLLILDSVEFLWLADAGLVEGVGLPSSNGQPLAPEYVLLVNSEINSLMHLQGKRAVFYLQTGTASTQAWIETMLWNQRLGNVSTFFAAKEMARSPSACILPLFFGRADACVIDSRSWETTSEMNPQLARKLKVLSHSVPVMAGIVALSTGTVPNREQLIRSLLEMHKYPAGQQIQTVFRSGPLIPYRTESCDSTRQFWEAYQQTLTPAQLKQWSLTLMPNLPQMRIPDTGTKNLVVKQ